MFSGFGSTTAELCRKSHGPAVASALAWEALEFWGALGFWKGRAVRWSLGVLGGPLSCGAALELALEGLELWGVELWEPLESCGSIGVLGGPGCRAQLATRFAATARGALSPKEPALGPTSPCRSPRESY